MSMGMRERFGRFVGGIKENQEDQDEKYEKWALDVDADRMLIYRMDTQWRYEMELLDESIDIEDRVTILDEEIEMVEKRWGRGAANPEWTIRYNAWRDLIGWWEGYVTRRSPTYRQTLMIEQEVEFPLPGKEDNKMKVVRTVKVNTASSLLKQLGKEKVRIIKGTESEVQVESSWNSAFTESQVEEFVKSNGESIMLQRGKKLSNWANNEFDITARKITVFHGTMNQEEHRGPKEREDDMKLKEAAERFRIEHPNG